MSEQFLRAWAVDADLVAKAIGGKDASLVGRAMKRKLAKELGELFKGERGASLEDQLAAIVAGKKPVGATWSTIRCLSLLADTLGKRVDKELGLPGRGWHELGPAWKHWRLPGVAKLWASAPKWTKKYGAWPCVMLADGRALPKLQAELEAFDTQTIAERGVPRTVERFGEGEWEMDDLASVVEPLRRELIRVCKAAAERKSDLLLVLDGSR